MEIKEFVTFNTVFIVFIYLKTDFFSYQEICSEKNVRENRRQLTT